MSTKQVIARGLKEFVNPSKIGLLNKDVRTQMLELNGLVEFDKGNYHNQNYENLIKNLKESRSRFSKSSSLEERKSIANQQYQQWLEYASLREKDLTEEFRITDRMIYQLEEIWDLVKDRKQTDIQPSKMLEFHSEYTKKYNFDIPLERKCLAQLIHPHLGYLSYFENPIKLKDLIKLYKFQTLASFERSLGQDLLASEISSIGFWNYHDSKSQGYKSIEEFTQFFKIFRYNIDPNNFSNEFKFALSLHEGEYLNGQENIIRFDFYRYLFLERNL